jgi:hypothetical protein
VGDPLPGAVTEIVAVSVTFWPYSDGLRLEVRTVDVAALVTGCETPPMLARKFGSATSHAV